jgi:uncharacterized repeat protein (TIGR03803 family)
MLGSGLRQGAACRKSAAIPSKCTAIRSKRLPGSGIKWAALRLALPRFINLRRRSILKDLKSHSAFGLLHAALFLGVILAPERAAVAQTLSLEKIYTFSGTGHAGYGYIDSFYDAPLILGTGTNTTLWFTSQKGGLDDEGEVAKFNLATGTLTVMGLNFGGTTETEPGSGNFINDPAKPEATPVYDNGDGTKNYLYFTTVAGGLTGTSTGGGTLVRYDMDTNTYETVWHAPAVNLTGGRQPRGTVAIVDRGVDGKDIYFTASGGGAAPSTSAGGVMRYNTKTGVTSVVADFDGNPSANMPYDGFVRVGDKLYFTTFGGGGGAGSTGNGTLSAIDISDPANPTFSIVTGFPGTATSGPGSEPRIGGSTPIYDSLTDSLYFTTLGSNGNPGTVAKFSLETGVLETLYTLPSGPLSGPNAEGRQGGYNSPFIYDGYLYFISRNGGANDLGAISRLDLQTNEVLTLYHLTTATGGVVYGDFGFSDYDFDEDGDADPALYFMTTGSAADGNGSIVRLTIPEPGSSVLCLAGAVFALGARRRKRS